ncbi:uncharacterized protein FIBRA_05078 [Fibroporia radiculosa]|uniref:Uncharacterized protein n=1 Tax=Fibroporia radiculosa TaxID=599839 RepID=J4G8H3_9APHY|nr:uncharacterized protein FIBRA_05078 [Fibroporia radiculosa]CCM02963.1 predicted protein [Fibroporia radiculosa]
MSQRSASKGNSCVRSNRKNDKHGLSSTQLASHGETSVQKLSEIDDANNSDDEYTISGFGDISLSADYEAPAPSPTKAFLKPKSRRPPIPSKCRGANRQETDLGQSSRLTNAYSHLRAVSNAPLSAAESVEALLNRFNRPQNSKDVHADPLTRDRRIATEPQRQQVASDELQAFRQRCLTREAGRYLSDYEKLQGKPLRSRLPPRPPLPQWDD